MRYIYIIERQQSRKQNQHVLGIYTSVRSCMNDVATFYWDENLDNIMEDIAKDLRSEGEATFFTKKGLVLVKQYDPDVWVGGN